MKAPQDCKCSKCGYEWTAKVEDPKSCPSCKQYNWKAQGMIYDDMGQDEFNGVLFDLVNKEPASNLLTIPGVYELVAEEFNNDVLNEWERVKGVNNEC